jgi:hypothetical protein
MRQTLVDYDQVKLTLTLKLSLAVRTPLIWTKRTKKCFRSAELDSPTPRVKRQSVRLVKSSSKKLEGWPRCRSNVNSRQLEYRYSNPPKLEVSTTTSKFLSKKVSPKVVTIQICPMKIRTLIPSSRI